MEDENRHDKYIESTDKGDLIYVEQIDKSLLLTFEQMNELDNGNRPENIRNLKFIESHGIKFRNYYEIPIVINHKEITFNIEEYWPIRKLTFKISENQVEISPVSAVLSSVMAVLFEVKYFLEIDTFASIKIVIDNKVDYREEFCKALYHLNRSLDKVNLYAEIFPDISDEDLNFRESYEDLMTKIRRVKNIPRPDFKSIHPLNLYNNAVTAKGEIRFLSLYRILEFYMETGFQKHIDSIRYDTSKSNDELGKEFRNNKEIDQLTALLSSTLTESKKKAIRNYSKAHELIASNDNFKDVIKSLYRYRNSIVHAKEKEINSSVIPSVFHKDKMQIHWIKILEDICVQCINRHNTV